MDKSEKEKTGNPSSGAPVKNKKKRTPPPKGGLIPKAERLFRFRLVEASLRNGKRGAEIMEELHSFGRHVSWAQVSEYIADVRYKWEQEDAQLRPIWRERQLRKLHEIARQIEETKAWGHWIRLQELIAKVEGNFAPEKIDVTTHTDEFEGWTVEELKHYVESDGREIPLRFRPAQTSSRHGSEVPWESAEGGNGRAGTIH